MNQFELQKVERESLLQQPLQKLAYDINEERHLAWLFADALIERNFSIGEIPINVAAGSGISAATMTLRGMTSPKQFQGLVEFVLKGNLEACKIAAKLIEIYPRVGDIEIPAMDGTARSCTLKAVLEQRMEQRMQEFYGIIPALSVSVMPPTEAAASGSIDVKSSVQRFLAILNESPPLPEGGRE